MTTVEKLTEAGIIPDLIDDSFAFPEDSSIKIVVDFFDLHVEYGNELRPAKTVEAPRVRLEGTKKDMYYTLIMADPDAPSRANPEKRNWRHYILANIPGDSGKGEDGEVIESWQGPGPPEGTGLHRYIFLLYEHEDEEGFVQPASLRGGWKVTKFLKNYDLPKHPVAVNWFVSQNDKQ
jgi:hypothetical protein